MNALAQRIAARQHADQAFRDTLSQQLGRYRFDIVSEPDADKAFAAADHPALMIVAASSSIWAMAAGSMGGVEDRQSLHVLHARAPRRRALDPQGSYAVCRTRVTFAEPGLRCQECAPHWRESNSRSREWIVVFAECTRAWPGVYFAFRGVKFALIGV